MNKKLKVLSKSEKFSISIYEMIKLLPKDEKYVIIPQILRSAISIPSNIAEGSQRTNKEFKRFIRISRGSIEELKVQLNLVRSVYNPKNIDKIIIDLEELGRMTYGLLLSLEAFSK